MHKMCQLVISQFPSVKSRLACGEKWTILLNRIDAAEPMDKMLSHLTALVKRTFTPYLLHNLSTQVSAEIGETFCYILKRFVAFVYRTLHRVTDFTSKWQNATSVPFGYHSERQPPPGPLKPFSLAPKHFTTSLFQPLLKFCPLRTFLASVNPIRNWNQCLETHVVLLVDYYATYIDLTKARTFSLETSV